jgi:hypothetical protein
MFYHELNNEEKGMTLWSVITVVFISVIGTNIMFNSSCEGFWKRSHSSDNQAFYAAEIGLRNALRHLKIPHNWLLGLKGKSPLIVGSTGNYMGRYTVYFNYDDPTNKKGTIISTGNCFGKRKQIVASIKHHFDSPFKYTVCGYNSVSVTGNAGTDSYDSLKGTYGGGNFASSGDIASNGDLSLGRGDIQGNVIAVGNLSGPNDCSISGNATIGGDDIDWKGNVSGVKITNDGSIPTPCNCLIDINTLINNAATNNDNSSITCCLTGSELVVGSGDSITLNNGTYYFTRFEISGNGEIHIGTPPVVIYLTGDGPFEIGGNGIVNASDKTNQLSVISNSIIELKLSGTGSFAGRVYAPNSNVKLTGNGHFYGSLVAKNPNISINGNLHYDKYLTLNPGPVKGDMIVELGSWEVD